MPVLIGLLVVIAQALTAVQSACNVPINKAVQAPVLTAMMIVAGNLVL